MPLKTSKSKEDVSKEKERIQKEIIERATGKDDFSIEDKDQSATNRTGIIKKKNRKYQERKMLYMDDEFFAMWQTYVSQELLKGNKVTFQGVTEELLKNFLKKNIKS